MAFGLETLAANRQAEVDAALDRANSEKNESRKLLLITKAINDLRESMANTAMASVKDDMNVRNFDEVKAHLRNELGRMSKPLIAAISSLKLGNDRIEQVKADIESRNALALEENFDLQIVKKPVERHVIDNLSDIAFPEDVNVKNLADLQQYFNDLAKVIKSTFNVKIPTPQVTVKPPEVNVNVPETIIPELSIPEITIPALDISPLAEQIKKLRETIKRNADKQGKQMTAFSGGLNESGARKAFKQVSQGNVGGSAALELTDAATAVQITATSTPCKYVEISTNGGLANIGGSDAVATSGSEVGVTIFPGNLPYKVGTDNLNKVYAAGAAGSRISWTYYV